MQIIEGAESAVDDLMSRITADSRHIELEVRDRRSQTERCFPHWSMYRVDVSSSFERGLAEVEDAVARMIGASTRAVVVSSLAAISTPA